MKKVMRDGAGLISITISGSPIDDDISEAEWLSVGFDTTSWVTASRFDLRNRNVIFIAIASEDVFSRNYYQENETDAVDRPSTGSKVTGIGPDDGGATAIEGVNKAVAVNKQSIGGKVTGIGPDDGGVTAVERVTVSSVLLAENAHLPAGDAFAPLAVLSDKYPAVVGCLSGGSYGRGGNIARSLNTNKFLGGFRMKKFMRIGAALFVAVAMLALIGCPTETETLETGAALLSVTIGGVSPTADDIPEGIPEAEWLSVGFDATSMETILFRLDRTLFGTEGVYADAPVATSKSAGAKVYYGLSNAGLLPSEWVTTSTFNLRNQNVIYIAVESEDGFSRNYYRVRVYRENQSAAVNTLSIGGKVTGSHALLTENAHFPADNAFAPLTDLSNKYPASRNVLYIKTFRLAGYLNFRRWWSV